MQGWYLLILIFSWIFHWINARFTCLSYVLPAIYGIEQLLSYGGLGEHPFQFAYGPLMLVIGMLHLSEGILAFCCGKIRSQAVISYNEDKIIGGYEAYGRWVVPLLLFTIKGIYIPILAAIIYFNETFTRSVEEKAEHMGLAIAFYGLGILILERCVRRGQLSLTAAMIIMPILHEMLLGWDRIMEIGENLYTYPDRGIRLMLFAKAINMPKPFDRGDVFLEVNGEPLKNEEDYYALKKDKYLFIHLKKVEGEEMYLLIKRDDLTALEPVFLPKE